MVNHLLTMINLIHLSYACVKYMQRSWLYLHIRPYAWAEKDVHPHQAAGTFVLWPELREGHPKPPDIGAPLPAPGRAR